MYSAIAANKRNTVFMVGGFLLVLGVIASIFSYIYQNWWISLIVILFGSLYITFQYVTNLNRTANMAGAQLITRQQAPELFNIVENLAIAEGIPTPAIYIIQDPAPNAFATGSKPEKSLVAVTTGLLDIMDKPELEGVIAHELSHIKNYDIRLSLVVFAIVSLVGFILDIFVNGLFWGGFGGRGRRGGSSNILALLIGLAVMAILSLLVNLLQLALSRQREYLADASGALLTRYPEGLAAALEKLRTNGRPMQRQKTALNHLYISDPTPNMRVSRTAGSRERAMSPQMEETQPKTSFFTNLLSTHPPLEKRIQRLQHSETNF